jgi:hypothetical protein
LGYVIDLAVEILSASETTASAKKTGVVENNKVLDHAGLLFDGPPAKTGLPFV